MTGWIILSGTWNLTIDNTVDNSIKGIATSVGVAANLTFALDAGAIDSYDGTSQSFLDQTANNVDLWRGGSNAVATDDPTYSGTPGEVSTNEYFTNDGSDFFKGQSMPSSLAQLHYTGATWSKIFALWTPNITTDSTFFWTGTTQNRDGVSLYLGSNETIGFRRANTASQAVIATSTAAVNIGAWNVVGYSIDEAAGAAGSFFYVNGTIETFDAAYAAGGVLDSTAWNIGGRNSLTDQILPDTTRLSGAQGYNPDLSQVNMSAIGTKWGNRFGLMI